MDVALIVISLIFLISSVCAVVYYLFRIRKERLDNNQEPSVYLDQRELNSIFYEFLLDEDGIKNSWNRKISFIKLIFITIPSFLLILCLSLFFYYPVGGDERLTVIIFASFVFCFELMGFGWLYYFKRIYKNLKETLKRDDLVFYQMNKGDEYSAVFCREGVLINGKIKNWSHFFIFYDNESNVIWILFGGYKNKDGSYSGITVHQNGGTYNTVQQMHISLPNGFDIDVFSPALKYASG
ncbi:hypothetical protein ACMXYV_07970 [Neptuniibacter sp. SY11_33]|uniref:hypothetical protein n=1 Tax=Neptuniibacter sp. SY11_33 TaxID=3398215 RepID=UPI0039F5C476